MSNLIDERTAQAIAYSAAETTKSFVTCLISAANGTAWAAQQASLLAAHTTQVAGKLGGDYGPYLARYITDTVKTIKAPTKAGAELVATIASVAATSAMQAAKDNGITAENAEVLVKGAIATALDAQKDNVTTILSSANNVLQSAWGKLCTLYETFFPGQVYYDPGNESFTIKSVEDDWLLVEEKDKAPPPQQNWRQQQQKSAAPVERTNVARLIIKQNLKQVQTLL